MRPALLPVPAMVAVLCTLAGCNLDGNSSPTYTPVTATTPTAAAAAGAGDVVAVTATGKVVTFNRAAPGRVLTSNTLTGLSGGEAVLAIDIRPRDGKVYALTNLGRLYTLDAGSGASTLVSTLAPAANDPFAALSFTLALDADFNPTVDRLRVVTDTGQSLRINVDTGLVTTDTALNGGTTGFAVSGAGYANAFDGATTTALYDIDPVNDVFYVQNPPNAGTLTAPVSLGVDVTAVAGFDVDAARNTGYGAFVVGGITQLYTVNLAATTAAAALVGTIGTGERLVSMALRQPTNPTVTALTAAGRLVSFAPASPNTLITDTPVSGLPMGETLVGIDYRPATGGLYGLTSNARLALINPLTGAVTVITAGGVTADPADTTAPFTALSGTSFSVDFNPVADRMRVVSNLGQNLRINVDTGLVTTDSDLNGPTPALANVAVISGNAYLNSYAGATATTLYNIDVANSFLHTQVPPNSGLLVSVGPLGQVLPAQVGFDIAGGLNGLSLAAGCPGGVAPCSLYNVALATGAATLRNGTVNPLLSQIGGANGPLIRDIAIRY